MTHQSANSEMFFLPGKAGNLLAVHTPALEPGAQAIVIVAPAFAEEMNRSRRMLALQARSFAAAGLATLEIDLFGSGDSAGDFGDATWDIWKADMISAIDWARDSGCTTIHLLGVRLGALLALDVARERTVDDIVFWQPAISGAKYMRDFLFQRVLAGMMQKSITRLSIEELRSALDGGETVEIGGYDLSPALYRQVEQLEIDNLRPGPGQRMCWIEVSQAETAEIKPDSRQVIDLWLADDLRVDAHSVKGHAFWVDGKVKVAPTLIDETASLLQKTAA